MRQDVTGAIFVAVACGLVVLATYRTNPNEPNAKLQLFKAILIAMSFAFIASFLIINVFFAYSTVDAEKNIIHAPPDF